MSSVSMEPEGPIKVEVEEVAYSPEIELADNVLDERRRALAVTITPITPGKVWSCTVTQGYYVTSGNVSIDAGVRDVMSRKSNQINTMAFKNGLRKYSTHMRGRLTSTQINYLLGSAVNTSLKYNGIVKFANGRQTNWFTTTSKFNVTNQALCQAETQNLLGDTNGPLSSFWAAVVAGVIDAAAMGIMMVAILAAFPELANPAWGPGAWDIALCASSFVGAIAYESLVIGGQINYMTAVEGMIICAGAVGFPWLFRGKFAGTYAPWMLKVSEGIRNGVARLWWYSTSTVADLFFNRILTREIELADARLPLPPAQVAVSTLPQGQPAGGIVAVPAPPGN